MFVIVSQVLRSPGIVEQKILAKFPELEGKIFSTNTFEEVLEKIKEKKDQKIIIITGNFLKTKNNGLRRNGFELLLEAKKISKNIKVVLYSSEINYTRIDAFDSVYEKEGAGDYDCQGYFTILQKEEIVKIKEVKINIWQRLLAKMLG